MKSRLQRALALLVLLALAAFALAFLAVALVRAAYPFDLDFLEDDVLLEAWRFAHGLPVFLPPNAEFVPHAYAPLYMLLSAALFNVVGTGYLPMRLLSLGATLASAGVLHAAARRLGCGRGDALIAPGLFLAGFGVTGFEYDLARVDALSIALMLAGTLAGISGAGSRRGRVASALLLALAFFAKQTAVLFDPAMALYLLLSVRKQALDFWIVYAFAVALPLGAMQWLTAGWSTTYLFIVPQADPVALDRIVSYIRHDLPRGMGALLVVCVLAALVEWKRGIGLQSPAVAWLLFTLLAIVVSGWARARLGGNTNSLMPAYAFLCLAPCIALGGRRLEAAPKGRSADRPPAGTGMQIVSGVLINATYLVILLQCALGLYNPMRELPTDAMRQGGERLIGTMRAAPGPVLVLEHPYYALLAGKAPSVALTALWHATGRGDRELPADLQQRFRERYYALIIGDEGTYPEVEALMETGWRETYAAGQALSTTDAAATLDGVIVQPRYRFTPK